MSGLEKSCQNCGSLSAELSALADQWKVQNLLKLAEMVPGDRGKALAEAKILLGLKGR